MQVDPHLPGAPRAFVSDVPPPIPAQPIAGWTPAKIDTVRATRRTGRIVSSIDALRGVTELGNGQPLSGVQVATLAPYLAAAYDVPERTVREDLDAVRIYTGGAALGPGWATTIGRDIYVNGRPELERLLSWGGRRWLTHELGHTMQWRRIPARDDLSRLRKDYGEYTLGLIRDPRGGLGGLPKGVASWIRERLDPEPGARKRTLFKWVHDRHPMEMEAESHARRFAGLPPTLQGAE